MPWYNVKVVGKQRVKWATPFFSQDAASVFKLIIFVQLTVNFLKLRDRSLFMWGGGGFFFLF